MIRYERFTKHFGHVIAVSDLDLDVRPGETLALIGPNGSGKTTTLKAALGLVRPTAGRVLVDGHDAEREGREARACLGYLPQRLSFPEGYTARELLRFFARVRGAEPDLRLLERVALLDAADRVVDGFSGGMRQRLGIAIAMLGATRALVLDEPTAALDPTGALTVRDILRDIGADGTTVLLSSHDLTEVAALADRVAVFAEGRMTALGAPAELARALGLRAQLRIRIAARPDSLYALVERAGASRQRWNGDEFLCEVVPGQEVRVLQALRDAGVTLHEIVSTAPGLEEVYRQATSVQSQMVA